MAITNTNTDVETSSKADGNVVTYSPSVSEGEVATKWQDTVAELKHTFLTKDGWVGDYVSTMMPICMQLTNLRS